MRELLITQLLHSIVSVHETEIVHPSFCNVAQFTVSSPSSVFLLVDGRLAERIHSRLSLLVLPTLSINYRVFGRRHLSSSRLQSREVRLSSQNFLLVCS